MSDRSPIEWTDATLNPVRGCTKVEPGLQILLRGGVFWSVSAACLSQNSGRRLASAGTEFIAQSWASRVVPERSATKLGSRFRMQFEARAADRAPQNLGPRDFPADHPNVTCDNLS